MPISAAAERRREQLIALRRDLHMHPELGFRERRTAGLVAGRLRALGLTPREGIAKTGVTAVIEGGAGPGPTLLLRADMDALPVEETSDVPYRSTVPGCMHACGHDGHTAVLTTLAEVLLAERGRLAGRAVLLFQPAEEGPGGAKPMLEAGVLDDPKVDAAIALHVSTAIPTGELSIQSGPTMAAVDEVEIAFTARGGHGAKPHESADPVLCAAHAVVALQALVSRERDPLDPAVLTIGAISGGEAFNVIPPRVALRGTIRTYGRELRAQMPGRLRRLVEGVAAALGCGVEVAYDRLYPALVNDAALADLVRAAAREVVGEAGVGERMRGMWSEDFAYFAERVPACFFFVGGRDEARGLTAPHHTGTFDFDEEALVIGLDVLRCAALAFLAPGRTAAAVGRS